VDVLTDLDEYTPPPIFDANQFNITLPDYISPSILSKEGIHHLYHDSNLNLEKMLKLYRLMINHVGSMLESLSNSNEHHQIEENTWDDLLESNEQTLKAIIELKEKLMMNLKETQEKENHPLDKLNENNEEDKKDEEKEKANFKKMLNLTPSLPIFKLDWKSSSLSSINSNHDVLQTPRKYFPAKGIYYYYNYIFAFSFLFFSVLSA